MQRQWNPQRNPLRAVGTAPPQALRGIPPPFPPLFFEFFLKILENSKKNFSNNFAKGHFLKSIPKSLRLRLL